ncbi:MAG: alpha/beta hydrolase, partial [Planctomycetes bacterium]|nr:alpha/beta hydrolase [Planctomycetota bacterium]
MSSYLPSIARCVAPLSLLVYSACSSGRYHELRPESEHPRFGAESARSAEASAFETVRLETRGVERRDALLRLAVYRPRHFAAPRLIVLLHGALSDHRTFRFLAPRLSVNGRCDVVAIDLPGCGESEGWPARRGVCGGFTPAFAAERVLDALEALEPELPRGTKLLLVGHSYGGAVALHCAEARWRERFPRAHSRIDGLALIAPYDVSSGYKVPELEQIARLDALQISLAQVTGFLHRAIGEAVWEGSATPGDLPREEADRLIEILSRGELRRAAQWMLRRAAPWRADGTLDSSRAAALERQLRQVPQPCLLLWGAQDDTLPLELGENLRAKLARAELRVITASKHSPQVEQPAECARAILSWGGELPDGAGAAGRGSAHPANKPPPPGIRRG